MRLWMHHVTQHWGSSFSPQIWTQTHTNIFQPRTDNWKGQELLKVKCSRHSNSCWLPCLLATGCGVMSMESMLFFPLTEWCHSFMCVRRQRGERVYFYTIYHCSERGGVRLIEWNKKERQKLRINWNSSLEMMNHEPIMGTVIFPGFKSGLVSHTFLYTWFVWKDVKEGWVIATGCIIQMLFLEARVLVCPKSNFVRLTTCH